MLRCVGMLLGGVLVVSVALPAAAKGTDDATRSADRRLVFYGIRVFEAGNFEAAHDKLDRAVRALRVHSLGLWSARAL